jgi:hypothetical protein
MRDGMWKRIGRVAKDKVSGAKDWVDDGASTDKDVNVRGAASGAVIGVRRYICLPVCLGMFHSRFFIRRAWWPGRSAHSWAVRAVHALPTCTFAPADVLSRAWVGTDVRNDATDPARALGRLARQRLRHVKGGGR